MKKLFYVDESFDMGGRSYIARNSKAVNDREAVKNLNDMYEMLESKLDLIRCGIGANYSGDPKQNPKYLEVVELLKRARGE